MYIYIYVYIYIYNHPKLQKKKVHHMHTGKLSPLGYSYRLPPSARASLLSSNRSTSLSLLKAVTR